MQLNLYVYIPSIARFCLATFLSFTLFLSSFANDGSIIPVELKCNFNRNPFGIDDKAPHLSWQLKHAGAMYDQVQSAYEVQVASSREKLTSNNADLWTSGILQGSTTTNIRYAGKSLRSEQTCYWRVRVWDKAKKASPWSELQSWTMGLLPGDWRAEWIQDSREKPANDSLLFLDNPAPLFLKNFTTKKKIRKAFVHISGLGFYHLYLNNRKVGNRALDPAWTDYAQKIMYSSFDITDILHAGGNELRVLLGNGWYNPLPLRMWGVLNLRKVLPVGNPSLIVQLNITYEDGSSHTVVSDESWKVTESHVLRNSIYLGERHDMVRKQRSTVSQSFRSVRLSKLSKEHLVAQNLPPIVITDTLRPKSIQAMGTGKYVIDFGKNFAGVVSLSARGKAGNVVRIRYGELLYDDGSLNVMTSVAGQIKRRRAADAAPDTAYRLDEVVLSGDNDAFVPLFSYTGFRYVEVIGYPGTLDASKIHALRINTDLEQAGSFVSSDTLLNRIYQNSINTFLSNVHSVQSDCPHRERFGYGGDIAITCPSFILSFDMKQFYEKTLDDYVEAQRKDGAFTETAPFVGIADEGLTPGGGPIGWGYVVPVMMEEMFRYYGDTNVISRNYEPFKNWINYLHKHSKQLIIDKGISDHESIDPKPVALTSTAFFYRSTLLLAKFAALLNKQEDQAHYSSLAEAIKQALLRKFFDPSTGKFDIGTQAAQSFALEFNLVPADSREKAVNQLMSQVESKKHHVATGMFGTLYMLKRLTEAGHYDDAWKIVQQRSFPGWGYMIERGATTIWEHWEFSDNTFSHNHPMWGSVVEWIVGYVAGIRPAEDAAGFNRFVIQPYGLLNVDQLQSTYKSVKGDVSVRWIKEGSMKKIQLIIPVNTTAKVRLPHQGGATPPRLLTPGAQQLSVKPVLEGDWYSIDLGSGEYAFEIAEVGTYIQR